MFFFFVCVVFPQPVQQNSKAKTLPLLSDRMPTAKPPSTADPLRMPVLASPPMKNPWRGWHIQHIHRAFNQVPLCQRILLLLHKCITFSSSVFLLYGPRIVSYHSNVFPTRPRVLPHLAVDVVAQSSTCCHCVWRSQHVSTARARTWSARSSCCRSSWRGF